MTGPSCVTCSRTSCSPVNNQLCTRHDVRPQGLMAHVLAPAAQNAEDVAAKKSVIVAGVFKAMSVLSARRLPCHPQLPCLSCSVSA